MKAPSLFFLLIFLISTSGISQININNEDTIMEGELTEVVVRAFEQNRRLKDVPAAVSYIGRSSLGRYNNTSILPALNSAPGIRMEERSPGSYRLNIRGSSLRAPFGVRNVKVYYNNIPLTDPGGHTYLNQLGFYNFQSIEVIKGPGSSLYGSGTGGVMLIESTSDNWREGINADYSTGSYDLQNISASARIGSDGLQNTITFQHQTSSGYREHSAMRRDVLSWNTSIKMNDKSSLSANFLYGDLYYQIPGPLTLAEYSRTPKSARPRVGLIRGSVETKAAIFQKTFLAGASYTHLFNANWQNTTTLYGAYTQLKNPTFRNYGRNSEPHFGGRTTLQYQKTNVNSEWRWHFGAEIQQGLTSVLIYNNVNGNPDSLQTNDDLHNRQAFVFSQLSWEINDWMFTGGLSLNQLKMESTRLSTFPITTQVRRYNNELAPRVAVLRKLTDNISAYSSVARGFSPPTSAEVLPSSGIINTALNAEQGINYEAGIKGSALKGQFIFDINAYLFRLSNTIVQRRDATAGDFFVNAGSTRQKGVESYLSLQPILPRHALLSKSKMWVSHTYNNFKYRSFKQLNNDYSGNRLPGIAPHTLAAGLDLTTSVGAYINLTYYYSDPLALNDANTDFASSYNLLGSRAGFRRTFNEVGVDIYLGADNLFDQKYSLGNDVNGFGGRYYNAAPGRNYFAGISLQYLGKK